MLALYLFIMVCGLLYVLTWKTDIYMRQARIGRGPWYENTKEHWENMVRVYSVQPDDEFIEYPHGKGNTDKGREEILKYAKKRLAEYENR